MSPPVILDEGDLPPLVIHRRPHIIPFKRRSSSCSGRSSVVMETNFARPDDETAFSFKRNTNDELANNFAYKCPLRFDGSITGTCLTPDNESDPIPTNHNGPQLVNIRASICKDDVRSSRNNKSSREKRERQPEAEEDLTVTTKMSNPLGYVALSFHEWMPCIEKIKKYSIKEQA
jgi:hypothetical protein